MNKQITELEKCKIAKQKYLGCFNNEEDAKNSYLKAKENLHNI